MFTELIKLAQETKQQENKQFSPPYLSEIKKG